MAPTNYSLSQYYSSNAFLTFTIGSTIYSCLTFISFGLCLQNNYFSYNAFVIATICVLMRILAVVLLWLIWAAKPGRTEANVPQNIAIDCLRTWLPELQAAYPVVISIALTFRLIVQLVMGDCDGNGVTDPLFSFCSPFFDHGGVSLRLAVELMFNPILTAFLLRDTLWEALLGAWIVAVAILVAFCAIVSSVDVIIATVAYVFCSVLLYIDNSRAAGNLQDVFTELHRAQQEIDRLGKEAQAIELRAMIGNVAHDLKTVRNTTTTHYNVWPMFSLVTFFVQPLTSFLNGVECTLEVITSWEGGPARSPASSSVAASQTRTRSNLHAMRKCLLGMKSTTSFMTMTINRCLDYTKTNAGLKLTPKLSTAYLKSLLDMPIKMMQDAQNNRDYVLHPLSSAICTHVITDKQWLLENLLCLLSNAVKYSLRGKIEVSVQLEQPVAGDPTLVFRVMDAGIGLSEEAMLTLFNPFKQAQRLAGGTGLGLFSLAKRVEALQGMYGVERRPDGLQGSLFWFTIPYRPDISSAALNSESSVESSAYISLSDDDSQDPLSGLEIAVPFVNAPQLVDAGQRRYHVLVVDDASLIVKMTTMLLQRKGHTVRTAVNGAEGLDLILASYRTTQVEEQESDDLALSDISGHSGKFLNHNHSDKTVSSLGAAPFDVVLMDLQMPIMDGFLAMRRLRASEEHFRRDYQGGCQEGQGESPHQLQDPPSLLSSHFRALSPSAQPQSPSSWTETKEVDLEMGLQPDARLFHQFVIAVSANADQETVDDALHSGADLFMTKPFSYDTFQEMMEKAGK